MLVGFFFEGPFTKPPPPVHCCWSHISCFGSFCNLDCSRKGGGQSKYMTALYWFCHFSSISTNLSGRLGGKLSQFRSHTWCGSWIIWDCRKSKRNLDRSWNRVAHFISTFFTSILHHYHPYLIFVTAITTAGCIKNLAWCKNFQLVSH